jgi:TonB family protein
VAGWAIFLLQASGLAQAQTVPPAKTDGDIKTPFLDNYTPSEEVKRRAMGPLRIIKQTVDQKKPATPAAAPSPAPVSSPAPSVVAKPRVEEATAKVEKKVPVAETPAAPQPVVVAAPAPVPVPAPVVAPLTPPPEPPKVAKHVNTELIPLAQDPPVINRNLMREIPKGVVKVAFDVNPDGTTSDVQAVSSTNRRLNASAVEAVSKWRFKPIDESVRVDIELSYSSE